MHVSVCGAGNGSKSNFMCDENDQKWATSIIMMLVFVFIALVRVCKARCNVSNISQNSAHQSNIRRHFYGLLFQLHEQTTYSGNFCSILLKVALNRSHTAMVQRIITNVLVWPKNVQLKIG